MSQKGIANTAKYKKPKQAATQKPKPSALERYNPLSQRNIERRKAREEGSDFMTAQTPISESDMRPFMQEYDKTVDGVVDTMHRNLEFISGQFGSGLYAITKQNLEDSIERVAATVTSVQRTRELVEVMTRNLEAQKVFADELQKIRTAAKSKDIVVLIDALLKFAKFFDTELWSKYNYVTEKVFEQTGFAIGKFTRDFHLQWMKLLKNDFVQSIMEAVAIAAKSLKDYEPMRDKLIAKRKEIEATIDENLALKGIWSEGESLYRQYQVAVDKINRLEAMLEESKTNTFTGETISESELREAVALANDLDQKIKEVEIRYVTAAEATLAASRNAKSARLPLHAVALHAQSVAMFLIYSGEFVQNTAIHFAVHKLLNITRDAKTLAKQGLKAAAMPQVGKAVDRLGKDQVYEVDIPRDDYGHLDVHHVNTGMRHRIPTDGGVVYDANGKPVITSEERKQNERGFQHLKVE